MGFKFDSLQETPEEEVARLRREGRHRLADIPVAIEEYPLSMLINLRPTIQSGENLIVLLADYRGGNRSLPDGRFERHGGYYRAVVVYSELKSYPVGGYDIIVSGAEACRGERVRPEELIERKNQD